MPKDGQAMSSLEMRNLILEALAEEDKANTPYGMTFKMYGYKGCVSDLRVIVEYLAVKHNIIDKEVDSLRFYYLGNKYQTKVEHIGVDKGISVDGVLIL